MPLIKKRSAAPFAAVILLACAAVNSVAAGDVSSVHEEVIGTRVVDLDGRIHRPGMTDGLRPVAIVLLDSGCPIARRYAPELNALFRQCSDQGVEFYGMLSDPLLTREEAVKFRDEFRLEYPIIWDSAGDLAIRLKPSHFPECFVISPRDEIIYRGRIDNRFAAVGKLRGQVTEFELRDAIAAAAAGTVPEVRFAKPVGCLFESW